MATYFYVARSEKGYIVAYGSGPTPALAEIRCRNHVAQQRKDERVAAYEPYKMPKPKFRKGQKIRSVEFKSITHRVLAIPDSPMLAGSIATHTILGGCRVWESENKFEAA